MKAYEGHDLGPDFEPVVISCALNGTRFYEKYSRLLLPEAFQDDDLRFLVELLHSYFAEYKRVPSKEVLCHIIRQSDYRDRESLVERVETFEPVHDDQYVASLMRNWCKWRKINNIVDGLNTNESPDEFAAEISRASRVGDDLFFTHTSLAKDDGTGSVITEPIETPWEWLNGKLYGGPRRQDLCIILSFVNVGKTALLVNIARHGIALGLRVVYFTFEDGEKKIKRRLLQSIANMSIEQMMAKPKRVRRMRDRFLELTGGELEIKELRPRRATVDDAVAFLHNLEDSTGRKVDLVITDYADRFKPPRNRRELRHECQEIFEDCKFLAIDLDVVHWTASQVQRTRAGKEQVSIEHVAESIGKVEPADIVIGIGQTREDEAREMLTLYTAKMRDGKKGEMHRLSANFEVQRIEEAG